MVEKKIDRIFRLIQIIGSDNNLNADELASRCNVSKRTIYRYLSSISEFIPICYEEGYKFLYTHSLPQLNLTNDELFALRLAVQNPATGPKSPYYGILASAISKLEEIMNPKYIEDNTDIKIDGKIIYDYSLSSKKFTKIEQAIKLKKQIVITYFSLRTSRLTERAVDPYALIFRRHAWYLIGYCHLRKNIRTFRIERIKQVEVSDKQFERPDDFNIESYFEDAWELYKGGELIEARIRFDPRIAPLILEGKRHSSQKIEIKRDGSLIYTIRVRGIEEIARWVLSFGRRAEALSPPQLRRYVAEELRGALKNYRPED
ncbi:MAG: helix-turn-helix transcriptional regulator [bacterium]